MRIAYLNINKAARERARRLVDYLVAQDADVIGLGEATRSNAPELFRCLAACGYEYACFRPPDNARGAIAAVSRIAPVRMRIAYMHRSSGHDGMPRIAEMLVGGAALTFVYFPNHAKKVPYFRRLLRDGRKAVNAGHAAALIGDFNTGDREDYGGPKGFYTCQEEFDALKRLGFRDVMLSHNPGGREWTWMSTFGNGFRLDHTLGNAAFAKQVRAAYYDHRPRLERLTDHSAMIVALNPSVAGPLG